MCRQPYIVRPVSKKRLVNTVKIRVNLGKIFGIKKGWTSWKMKLKDIIGCLIRNHHFEGGGWTKHKTFRRLNSRSEPDCLSGKIDYENAVQITPEYFETLKQQKKEIIPTKIVFYLIYGNFYFSWIPSLMSLTERGKKCNKLVCNKNSRVLPIMTAMLILDNTSSKF